MESNAVGCTDDCIPPTAPETRRFVRFERLRRDAPAVVLIATMVLGLAMTPIASIVRDVNQQAQTVSAQRLTARFDEALETHHPWRTPALRAIALLRLQLFRQGNGAVVVGREGWLYTEEELRWGERDAQLLNTRLQWIAQAVRSAGNDTRVVVLLLPSKARVYPEALPRTVRALAEHPRYEYTLQTLRARGVAVVDGRDALSAKTFFRRDTHWRPKGAVAAARAVGQTVDATFSPAFVDTLSTDDYALRWTPRVDHVGDLLSFVPVGPFAADVGFGAESYRTFQVESAGVDALGLFDAPDIPVALVGTSYSADPRWGFEDALRVALSADVLNVAEQGRGPFVPMASYLDSDTIRDIPPQLVVWEIPERYLTLPEVELPSLPTGRYQDLPGTAHTFGTTTANRKL